MDGIVILFLIIIFAFGWIASKEVTSFKDYSTGRGEFSTFTLVASMVGTWIGSNIFIAGGEYMFQEGWAEMIATMTIAIAYFLNGWFIVPRLAEYEHTFSLAYVLGKMYGPVVQVLAAISMLVFDICRLVIEYIILQKVLQVFFGIDPTISLIIVIVVTALYTIKGGVIAVILTDVIQYIVFIVGLPLILYCVWDENTYDKLWTLHEYKNFNLSEYFAFNTEEFKHERLTKLIGLIILCAFPCMNAARFQRFLAAKDHQKAKWVFVYSGIIIVCIYLVMKLINIAILLNHPKVIEGDVVLNYINILYNTGFGAWIAIVILSMSMSTMDSIINATAVTCVNDILRLFKLSRSHDPLHMAKISGLFISIISAAVVINGFNKTLIELLNLGSQCYVSAVVIPMLLHIYNFRFDKKGAEMGIISALVLVVILQIVELDEVYGFVTLLFATPALMYIWDYIIVSYRQNNLQDKITPEIK